MQVSDLKPNKRNPRKISKEKKEMLKKAVEEFGDLGGIVFNRQTKQLVGGHQRVSVIPKSAEIVIEKEYDEPTRTGTVAEGYVLISGERFRYRQVDWPLAREEAANISANKQGGEWEDDKLREILADLVSQGMDMDLVGFTTEELEKLMGSAAEVYDAQCDEDEVGGPPVEPRSKLGDMYELGKHRLLCGDSTDPDVIAKLMAGTRADFCFTSPPYSDQREYNGGKELSPSHLAKFLMAPVKCFAVNLGMKRKDGRIDPYWNEYIAIAESLTLPLTSWNIWNRQGFGFSIGNATALFPIEHEFIFIFGTPDVTNCVVENKSAGRSDDYQTIRLKDGSTKERAGTTVKSHRPLGTVAHIGMEAERTIDHPAKFPVKLPETYIEACSKEGASIYEPFGGSGTSLIACEKTKRKCYMMELDPQYVDVIVSRYVKFSGNSKIKRNGEEIDWLKSE